MPRCCIVTGNDNTVLARVEVVGEGPAADAAARVAAAHAVGQTADAGPIHFEFLSIPKVSTERPSPTA